MRGTSFRVSRQPEFLFSEEALVHKRSWSENLTYYTGWVAVPAYLHPPCLALQYPAARRPPGPRLPLEGTGGRWLSSEPHYASPFRRVGYLAGALLGGGKGAVQAIATPVALVGVESTQRLRINQLLNTSGKMGRGAGAFLQCAGVRVLREGGGGLLWAEG